MKSHKVNILTTSALTFHKINQYSRTIRNVIALSDGEAFDYRAHAHLATSTCVRVCGTVHTTTPPPYHIDRYVFVCETSVLCVKTRIDLLRAQILCG